MNFLKETLDALEDNGKSSSDVLWCGSDKVCFTWDNFVEVANFSYDSGFGSQEVAHDLLIVGEGWWLERREYDGSEWWVYKSQPKRPNKQIKARQLKNRWGTPIDELEGNE